MVTAMIEMRKGLQPLCTWDLLGLHAIACALAIICCIADEGFMQYSCTDNVLMTIPVFPTTNMALSSGRP